MDAAHWERLEKLFDHAVAMAPDRLAPWIEQQTAADPEMGRQLRALLQHDAGAQERIADAIGAATEDAAKPLDWTGRRLGPYRIVREIGRGGMGLVFEACRDDDEVRKTVALKIAPWWRDLDLHHERFRSERQILAELEHPNIARFLDGGTEGGVPYFAMECVDGRPITEYARGRKLPERLDLFREVCAAVQYAHEHLVVHRDLKPGNILVTREGVPKLLDFGIAKLLSPLGEGHGETVNGMASWTPDYASPEQIRAGRITTRTDVYSLGLILFEILTGERAQIADTSSPLAMDRSICEIAVPAPSSRVTGQLARQLAGDLDTITTMATHKDPERRYASVADFSADLGRYLEDRPVLARKDRALYRASKFVRRHWIPILAGVVAALGLAGGAAGFAWQARVAQHRFDEVRKLATVFLFDVHDQVAVLPGSTGVRDTITRIAVESLDNLSRDAGNNYALRRELAAGYLRLGTVQGSQTGANLGRHVDAVASFDRGLELLNGLPQSELKQAATTEAGLRENRGRNLNAMGKRSDAEADLKRALGLRTALCLDPVHDKAQCLGRISALAVLIEIGVRHSQVDAVDSYLKQYDTATEELRPALSAPEHQAQRLRSSIFHARLEYIRHGYGAAADMLRPAFPTAQELVRGGQNDDNLRLGVIYCLMYGSMALEAAADFHDPELEAVLKQGLEWSEALAKRDPQDQRSQDQSARLEALLGASIAREEPARGVPLLRRAIRQFLDDLRLAPANVDALALLVDTSNHLVRAYVRLGRETEAAIDLRDVLKVYDPLTMIGLKLERPTAVREMQARAWIAGERTSFSKAVGAWDLDAARIAEAALDADLENPALEAASAQLYDLLSDKSKPPNSWKQRANGLWRRLALKFPDNPAVSNRVPR